MQLKPSCLPIRNDKCTSYKPTYQKFKDKLNQFNESHHARLTEEIATTLCYAAKILFCAVPALRHKNECELLVAGNFIATAQLVFMLPLSEYISPSFSLLTLSAIAHAKTTLQFCNNNASEENVMIQTFILLGCYLIASRKHFIEFAQTCCCKSQKEETFNTLKLLFLVNTLTGLTSISATMLKMIQKEKQAKIAYIFLILSNIAIVPIDAVDVRKRHEEKNWNNPNVKHLLDAISNTDDDIKNIHHNIENARLQIINFKKITELMSNLNDQSKNILENIHNELNDIPPYTSRTSTYIKSLCVILSLIPIIYFQKDNDDTFTKIVNIGLLLNATMYLLAAIHHIADGISEKFESKVYPIDINQ